MKDDRIYLLHIRDAVDRVLSYTTGGKTAFFADTRTQDAVVRNLEIIGEAAKNVSKDQRVAQPSVPWRALSGMRDKLIHEYFGVDLEVVWQVVERDIPELKQHLPRLRAQQWIEVACELSEQLLRQLADDLHRLLDGTAYRTNATQDRTVPHVKNLSL